MRAYNKSLAMGCVAAEWTLRGPDNYTINSAMTPHGRMNDYMGAVLPPSNLSPYFLPVYIHKPNYDIKEFICLAAVTNP